MIVNLPMIILALEPVGIYPPCVMSILKMYARDERYIS